MNLVGTSGGRAIAKQGEFYLEPQALFWPHAWDTGNH